MRALFLFLVALGIWTQVSAQMAFTPNFTAFAQQFFNFYNVSPTIEVTRCFDNTTAPIFFDWFLKFRNETQTIVDGDVIGYHQSYQLCRKDIQLITKSLHCVYLTTSFRNVLKVLNATKNPFAFQRLVGLYNQAFPREWLNISTQAYQFLEKGDFASAGTAFASALQLTLQNLTDDTISNAKLRALYNGVFLQNKLNSPMDSLNCLDLNSSYYILGFYQTWASCISQNGSNQTADYFNSTGMEYYKNVSTDVWNCLRNSQDSRRLVQKIGITLDPYDKTFLSDITSCIEDSQCSGVYHFDMYSATDFWSSENSYPTSADLAAGMDIGNVFLTAKTHTRYELDSY